MDCKLQTTIELIKKSDLSYSEISEKCEVSKGWISQVVNGIIEDPSVRKIETIYNFLEGEK